MGYKKKYETQYKYLLDCMNPDELPEDATPEQKVRHFKEMFEAEYNDDWKRKQWPILQDRIGQYLRGLPSSCTVDYENYSIILLGWEWGYIASKKHTDNLRELLSDVEISRFVSLFYKMLAQRLIEMFDYYDIANSYGEVR